MKQIPALFQLIRWPNLVIVTATQILIRQCIIIPVLKQVHMEPQMTTSLFYLLVLSTVLITAGGYIINDYFDRKIDRINKPNNLIVGTMILPRHAMAYHLIFSITGVITGVFIALKVHQLYLSLVFFMVSGLLWFYSTTYKRDFLIGSVIISLLTALVPFIVLLFEMPLIAGAYGSATAAPITKVLLIWVLGFSLFAFLLNLTREIVKDLEDLEGDQAYGKKTIPVVWGTSAARFITITLIIITITLLGVAWFFFVRDRITLIYFMALIVIPLIIVAMMMVIGRGQRLFHKASLMLKIVMLTGLCYAVVVNLLIEFLK